MNIKQIIPTSMMIMTALTSSCGKKVNPPQINQFANDMKLKTILADTFSHKMSDETKVIEYNKLLKKYGKNNGNYIIVNKKKCQATVYNADGKPLQISEVALGRDIGDKRIGGYKIKGAKVRAYTTPGEFDIIYDGLPTTNPGYRLYGKRVLLLGGDYIEKRYKNSSMLALHRVPATPMGKLRENVFNNGTIRDNRVSFGCVNFLVKSFDKMHSYIKGLHTKVYILPEEKGNSLYLEKQKNGTYKFFQKKYRYEYQENIKH